MAVETVVPNTHITDIAGRFRIATSDPTNPVDGDFYFDTATSYLKRYNGTSWIGALFLPA